jgi:hypothetical protein
LKVQLQLGPKEVHLKYAWPELVLQILQAKKLQLKVQLRAHSTQNKLEEPLQEESDQSLVSLYLSMPQVR